MRDIVIDKVKEAIDKLLQERAIELVDIVYRREQGGMVLRLLVDKKGGITLDDCAHLNEDAGKLLDERDIMPEKYILEVSSPGLDRPLKTRRDFERVMGKRVYVNTYEPIEGKKRGCEGIVRAIDDEKVTIDNTEIQLDKIAKAKLKIKI